MSSILQAIAQGYAPEEIIKFFTKKFPRIAPKISQAAASGYSADQILKYLTKLTEPTKIPKNLSAHEIEKLNQQKFNETGKRLIGATAAGIGATALIKNIPNIIKGVASGIGPQPMGGAPVQPSPSPQLGPQPPQGMPNAPQPPIQPQAAPLSPEGLQRKEMIDKLSSATPEFKEWANAKIEAGEEKPLDEMLKDFAREQAKKPKGMMQGVEQDIQKMEALNAQNATQEIPQAEEEVRKPSKGELVATPQGTGQLESIRDKEALVKDEDGKLHKVKADELISSPFPERDIAELHDDLVSGIEKETGEEVSKSVNWAGYDPTANSLAYLPHGGGLYVYQDIDPEQAQELTNVLNRRKTTGESFVGAWKEGTKSPIGNAMSTLIRNLQSQRGGKGKEYSNKFETVYHYLEPAQRLLKKKKKKRPQ